MRISNGGVVKNDYGTVGAQAGSVGSVVVDGASWVNQNSLYVGLAGTGPLNISNGGSVTNTLGVIGASAGSTGAVTVDTGSSWANPAGLIVGFGGAGSLMVSSGGLVTSGSGTLGKDPVRRVLLLSREQVRTGRAPVTCLW